MSRPDIDQILEDLERDHTKLAQKTIRALLDYVEELEEQRDEVEAANITFGKAMQELEGYRRQDSGYMRRSIEAQGSKIPEGTL